MGKLLLLFTIVPLIDTYLLFTLGQMLGFWETVAIVLITGVVGAFLSKREGLKALTRWREALSSGEMPEEGITGALLILVGGVLLVTPGVLTDLTGLSLLLPPIRQRIAKVIQARMKLAVEDGRVQVRTGPSVRVASPRSAAGPRRRTSVGRAEPRHQSSSTQEERAPQVARPVRMRRGANVIEVDGVEVAD